MERLTEKELEDGWIVYNRTKYAHDTTRFSSSPIRKIIEKLKGYEDLEERLQNVYGEHHGLLNEVVTGLERHEKIDLPQQVIKSRLLTDETVDRWDEYKALDKQGKLLKLPCAVGDTVYRVHKGTKLSPDRVYECKVVGVKQEYNAFSVKLHANINEETYSIWIDNWFDKCQIGHEFFLTREEVEVALKEMEENHAESSE